MKKIQKGFTLIELLIVIAIIGILAGVILVSTTSARSKAKMAAFKSEARGASSGLLTQCAGAAIAAPADTVNTDFGALTSSCGATGDMTFSLTATPLPAVTGCTATINQDGATFTSQCV